MSLMVLSWSMCMIRRFFLGFALVLSTALFSMPVLAFTISDIRVEGLQRVSAGTVFSALTFGVGDDVDSTGIRTLIADLFKTGSFDDVQVGRDGSVLVILVKERPSIASIELEGNKAIKSEAPSVTNEVSGDK